MSGPARQRLDQALAPVQRETVHNAAHDWRSSAEDISVVAAGLQHAAQSGVSIGGKTGPALWEAMDFAAANLLDHAEEMAGGAEALDRSAIAIKTALEDRNAIDVDLPTRQPEPYQPKPGDEDLDQAQRDLKKQQHDQHQGSVVADRETQREIRAQQVADAMEKDYEHPIKVMQTIYGYKKPKKKKDPIGGGGENPYAPAGAPTRGPGGRGGPDYVIDRGGPDYVIDGFPRDPGRDPDRGDPWPIVNEGPGLTPDPGPPTVLDPGTSDPDPTYGYPSDPSGTSGTPSAITGNPGSSGIPGGVLGGVAVTAGVGGLAAGLARSGKLSGLTSGLAGRLSTNSVAPIGTSARPGSPGTLGGTGARGGAGAGGVGTGARGGGRGAGGAGGRGAGGRGAGTGAGRRGGRKKDSDGSSDRDLFDDGEDWLDDEGAAPGTIS